MPPKTRADKSAKAEATLLSDRKAVAILSIAGFIFLGITYYGFTQWGNRYLPTPHIHSLTDRLVWTLRHQILGVLSVIWCLLHVSICRSFTSAINPLTGNDPAVERANRILTNTLEQFVVNAVNQLVFATYSSEGNLRLIPLLSAYFLIGRITFWIGYLVAPKYRAFGFTVTLWPTLVIAALNVYFFVSTNTDYLFDGGKPFGRVQ